MHPIFHKATRNGIFNRFYVGGQLTPEILLFVHNSQVFTAWKISLSDQKPFWFQMFFVFFFFSTETDDWWCTQFVEPTVWFPPQKQRRGSVTRGPRILVDLVGTHYLARFVHFHFLKFCLHLCVLTSTTDVQFFLEPPGSILPRAALKQLGQKRAPDLGRFSAYSLFGPLCSVSFLKFCLHLGATLISQ